MATRFGESCDQLLPDFARESFQLRDGEDLLIMKESDILGIVG